MMNTIGWLKRIFNLRWDDLFNGTFMFVVVGATINKRVSHRFGCAAEKLHLFEGGKRFIVRHSACEPFLICYVSNRMQYGRFNIVGFATAILFHAGF